MAYAEVGPGSVSEISSDSRTESESISEQVNFLKGKFLLTNALLGVLNSATETLTEIFADCQRKRLFCFVPLFKYF